MTDRKQPRVAKRIDAGGRRPARTLSRELLILGSLALALLLGLASLAGAYLWYRNDHDWTAVASVNGHPISREALRSRISVLEFLAQERLGSISQEVAAGVLTTGEAASLSGEVQRTLADPVTAARESLVADELLRQLAAGQGVTPPSNVDEWAEATRYAGSDTARTIRVIRFGLPTSGTPPAPSGSSSWPRADGANTAAATARLEKELSAGSAVSGIVTALRAAGWGVAGEDVAVSADGVPADPNLELDPSIAAGAVAAQGGSILGPTSDVYGRVSLGLLLSQPDTSHLTRVIMGEAAKAKLDTGALLSWADGQALKRAMTARLLAGWKSTGVLQAHFRELVLGAAPDTSANAGPWVELSGLMTDRLTGIDPAGLRGAPAGLSLGAAALPATLRSLGEADRTTLWRSLVDATNAKTPVGSQRSGELGFLTASDIGPAVASVAFDPKVRTGDVLGPITTPAGPELFLVEVTYAGPLDDRTKAALTEVRTDPSPDLVVFTKRFSPADTTLANDAGWRAQVEFGSSEPVSRALFETPLGVLSDPFVLDGKAALATVDARGTYLPDARMTDRLTLDGFPAWLASEESQATITRSANPLPELVPTASPTSSAVLPTMPPEETPYFPSVPGLSVPTPVGGNPGAVPTVP